MSGPVKKHTAKTISAVLKYRILHLEYLPGHRFTEQAICDEFEVSRIPVREALSMLIDMGLVDKVRNVGCRVRKLTLEDIDQIYELRIALELYAIEILADREDSGSRVADLTAAWKIYAATDPSVPINPEFWADADEHFHESLVQTLDNKPFFNALHDVNERIRFLRLKDITSYERLERTCAKHLEILEAVAQHDGRAARKLLHENILMGKVNVKNSFEEAIIAAYAASK